MKYNIIYDDEFKEIDHLNYKKLTIKNLNSETKLKNKFKILYDNNIFYIDSECMFTTCGLNNNYDKYKIGIILDKNVDEHVDLINIINYINDKLSHYIELDNDVDISIVKNPFNKSKDGSYILNLVLHNNCELLNYDNREKIKIEDIQNSRFYLYPIINSPVFLIYDDVCYTTYSIFKAYVKFISTAKSNKNVGPSIDYDKVTEALKKLNL